MHGEKFSGWLDKLLPKKIYFQMNLIELNKMFKNTNNEKIIIGLFILIILIIVGYIIASNYKGNDFSDNNITYSIRR